MYRMFITAKKTKALYFLCHMYYSRRSGVRKHMWKVYVFEVGTRVMCEQPVAVVAAATAIAFKHNFHKFLFSSVFVIARFSCENFDELMCSTDCFIFFIRQRGF